MQSRRPGFMRHLSTVTLWLRGCEHTCSWRGRHCLSCQPGSFLPSRKNIYSCGGNAKRSLTFHLKKKLSFHGNKRTMAQTVRSSKQNPSKTSLKGRHCSNFARKMHPHNPTTVYRNSATGQYLQLGFAETLEINISVPCFPLHGR